MSDNYSARCPACGEMIDVDLYSEIGDGLTCENCDAELEIVDVHPPRLRVLKKYKAEENDYPENFGDENGSFKDEEDGGY